MKLTGTSRGPEEPLVALCVPRTASLRDVMAIIDRGGQGIALVVGDDYRLEATMTDGDVRRALLRGLGLDATVADVLSNSAKVGQLPLVATPNTPAGELLRTMNTAGVRHIPIVDDRYRVVGISLLSELIKEQNPPVEALVMAGGFGKRLNEFTKDIPKPMLPIHGKPILEIIVDNLRSSGIRHVNFATHYKGNIIRDHFGDGSGFGVKINYVREDQPLGTAGALGLMDPTTEPLLVINGDILTSVNFRAMLDFHMENSASMTVAVKEHEFELPFGVVELQGECVTGICEKPKMRRYVNAGIYLINPSVRAIVPRKRSYDMPDLITALLNRRERVVGFPIAEDWVDIGHPADYRKAAGIDA